MSDDEEVGYGKPPKHSRFKKGRSGNPKGRPKGTRNFKTDVQDLLSESITVRIDGRATRLSSQTAALKQLQAKALKGDRHALDRLIALAERYGEDQAAEDAERALSQMDGDIVEQFKATTIAEYEAEKAAKLRAGDEEPET